MKHAARKAVVHYKSTATKTSLAKVYRKLTNVGHRHVCATQTCRLTYEDRCESPAVNGRCETCRGKHRAWVYADGLTALDPRPCCQQNTELMTDPEDLLRFGCAGPGPWFRCQRCKRTHGHPCIDQHLLDRPAEVAHTRGTT